jgi:hypothetical protein
MLLHLEICCRKSETKKEEKRWSITGISEKDQITKVKTA